MSENTATPTTATPTTATDDDLEETNFDGHTPVADILRYLWAHDHSIEQSVTVWQHDLIINFDPSGEYRFVRFTLGDPESTLSLVLHDSDTDWHIEYDRTGRWGITPDDATDLAAQMLRAVALVNELNAAVSN